MRVLLATSWGQAQCGIQAHSEELIRSVKEADSGIEILPWADALDPNEVIAREGWISEKDDVIHLNYHRALHSRWTADAVRIVKETFGIPVVITFHDTFGENPPDQLSQDLLALADAFVVHEPCQGLEGAIYWRQGVPQSHLSGIRARYHYARPILGTIGFDFGWKGFDRICVLAKQAGWGVVIITPEMSGERHRELEALNPWLDVYYNLPTADAVATLRECDATAFLYVCGNSGTSAAIRMGIGAGKPVIAYQTCRQFRDLHADPLGHAAIRWVSDEAQIGTVLRNLLLTRLDPLTVYLAEQDSWQVQGARYAALYRQVVADRSLA